MEKKILKIQASAFNALAHPLRLKILEKLRAGPCCVCEIIPYVGGEQSNVSHHLAILRGAGIVQGEKRGVEVWYEIVDPRIYKIIDTMDECIIGNLNRTRGLLQTITESRKSKS
ncbi:MAG: winged helix-turn-helix transcriptional regulator [candidate division WOR-3 bacterium]|nr:MAG: winged helix-turn-helix transcriptional regulator [candidate division WOR-3 bacterium]